MKEKPNTGKNKLRWAMAANKHLFSYLLVKRDLRGLKVKKD